MNRIIYSKLVLLFIVINIKSYSAETKISDTAFINFENQEKLILLTANTDSSEYWINQTRLPNPFSPSMENYSAIIILQESSFLKVVLNGPNGEPVKTFKWDSVERGVYKFRWWEYYDRIPSGIYYLVVTTKFNTTTEKVLLVR